MLGDGSLLEPSMDVRCNAVRLRFDGTVLNGAMLPAVDGLSREREELLVC